MVRTNRAKNKTSKMPSPVGYDSDSSSEWENNELPNQLKNLIDNDDIPKRKKKCFGDQIQPTKFRPSIVQRALTKNVCSSTPYNRNLGKLFFPSDSSYSPIDYIDKDDKSIPHTSRFKTQKNKSEEPVQGRLFDDKDKNTSPVRYENKSQTRKKKSVSPTSSCLSDDKDHTASPMKCSNKSRTRLFDDKDKIASPLKYSNKSQGDKIELICSKLRRNSETKKDDNCKHNALRILGKTTKSLNSSSKDNFKNSQNSRFFEPNNTLKEHVCAGTQRVSKLHLSQNNLGAINSEDDNCRLRGSECNKNKSDLIEVKRSSSKFRNSNNYLDENEVVNETSRKSRNNTPLLSKIISHNNSVAHRSYQNVTLRKSNGIVDNVDKPLAIQIIDDSVDSDSDCEPLTKKTHINEKFSKIPVLRSRSKSKEKCNKGTKSKKEESISHSQFHKSFNEKTTNKSNKVPVEIEDSEDNNSPPRVTSISNIAAIQSGPETDMSNLTAYVDERDCYNIYESVQDGSVVERFSSGYDHNVLDNLSINKPWRYSASGSNIVLPNDDGLNEKLLFKKLLPKKRIKRYSRVLSVNHGSPPNSNKSLNSSLGTKYSSFVEPPTKNVMHRCPSNSNKSLNSSLGTKDYFVETPTKNVMHRSPSNSNKSLNSSLDEVSLVTKNCSFVEPSTKHENNIIKDKSTDNATPDKQNDKIEKWLTEVIRLSQSKVISPEKSCSNLQNNGNGKVQTKNDNLNVTNGRILMNTDDKEVTEHNYNDSITENEIQSSLIIKSNKPRNPQNQSETNEENYKVNEENHEQSKNSVKKRTKKNRKSLRVLLENDWFRENTVNTKETSPIKKSRKKTNNDLKANEAHCERNEENGEFIEEDDETTKKDVKKIKPKIRKSLRILLKKSCINESTEKSQMKNQIVSETNEENCEKNEKNYETIEENCDWNDEISTQFIETQKNITESLHLNLKKSVTLQEIKPQDNEMGQSKRKRGKPKKNTELVQKNVTEALHLNLKKSITLQEIKPQDNEIGQSQRKIDKPKKNTDKGKSAKPTQEESVNTVNTGRPVRNRKPPRLGMYDTVIVDSSNKRDALLWNCYIKEDDMSTMSSTVTRKNKNTGTTKKNKNTGTTKKNNLKSKKSESNLSKKKETFKKPILKNKKLLMDSLDIANVRNSAIPETIPENPVSPETIPENPAIPENHAIPEISAIPENSCNFPEGVINTAFSDEENYVSSEMYKNHSNNNCPESNKNPENQLTKFDNFLMPQKQKSIDRDSGTSTMMEENVSRKHKNSTLTRGARKYNKSASRKTINTGTNTRSLRSSKPSLEYTKNESLGITSPPLEVESRNRESLRIPNPLLEAEYVELTDNDGPNRLKFVEKSANFAEMSDKLIYSDSLTYVTGTSIIYLQIPPCRNKSLHISKKHDVFYVVLEGNGRILIKNKMSTIEKLSRFIVPKGCSYSINNDSQTENMLLVCFRVPVT